MWRPSVGGLGLVWPRKPDHASRMLPARGLPQSQRFEDEAMAEIGEHHPKLMVLDVMMPEMDGWSVLEELMKLPLEERPRVVVVSALASLRDRAKAAELGADAYCPKPFNVEELLSVLHDLDRVS